MTYLPSKPPGIAGLLTGPDSVTVIQNGVSRRATLAQLAAFVVSAAPTGETAEGTTVTTVGPQITDAAGNTYAISSAGYVVTNGAPETTISANVVEIAYHAPVAGGPRQLYQKNASGNWFTRTSVTAFYTQTTDPFASPVTTVGTYFQVANGKIYTPSGAVFKVKSVNCTPYTGYAPSTYASVKRFFPGMSSWQPGLSQARSVPRCGAETRSHAPCQAAAMPNGRCRMHGGLSTVPRTAEGLARIRAARTKHGLRSAEADKMHRLVRYLKVRLKQLGEMV